MAGKFNINSETPEIAEILPSLIFLLIKMSLMLKVSPTSLPPYHTAQNQPSQRIGMGHCHIFVSAVECPDMNGLLSARVANAQIMATQGRSETWLPTRLSCTEQTPWCLSTSRQQKICIFAGVGFLSWSWDEGRFCYPALTPGCGVLGTPPG